MSIYVLDWIKEDLKKEGKTLNQFSLLELKDKLDYYKITYLSEVIR